MRVLICEDEPVTAARIERLTRAQAGVVDVQLAHTGAMAQSALERGETDMALLDINLPDMSGFDVARNALERGCAVVFITAYDMHAVRAFEIGAIDYLLKPVERARFDAMFQRVRERADLPRDVLDMADMERLVRHLRDQRRAGHYVHDFWIKDRERRVRVPVESILYIEASRDYAILHTPNRQHMIRRTMSDLERQLDPSVLLRIHRSYFVNLSTVDTLLTQDGRPDGVRLAMGQTVPVGPAYQAAVRLALRDDRTHSG
ncbi:LytR/AlgR family response regulator transcription factor [Maricaulis sp. D1M11]|uniref:LytR/AlgR family response regulator transcription factor n=1 Tax=Maricaulis sp. D1M11 TaxID=3076117 RepID=UPI0039B3DD45